MSSFVAAGLTLSTLGCARDRAGDETAVSGTVHAQDFADPKATAYHGALLRSKRWSPMLDGSDPDACGQCHEGTPGKPAGVSFAAPGAPACTTCHGEPGGVLACSTCHGDVARSGAHAAHLTPSTVRSSALACSTCHTTPRPGVIGGAHGNGTVDVVFDPAVVAPEASYDRTTGVCAVSCHDQGGKRARLHWTDTTPLGCNDCHTSPPAGHFAGACTGCHAEANATGTALLGGSLHMNGRVDLGDGSGACGACHGKGSDPWPRDGAHPSHQSPTLTTPIECVSCHVVPATILAPGHLDGVVGIAFSGRALDRGSLPKFAAGTCTSVACHGAGLADGPAAPMWTDTTHAASACGACHGIPPTQHTSSTSCERSNCHGSEVARTAGGSPSITPSGTLVHINGVIDLRAP